MKVYGKLSFSYSLFLLCVFVFPGSGHSVDLHGFQPVVLNPQVESNESIPENYQIQNDAFIDGPVTIDFSWIDYLQQQAPHLLEYAEIFSHWGGSASINPKLLIAIMELNSEMITLENAEAMANPFATHFIAENFNAQISQTLLTLSFHFYQALEDLPASDSTKKHVYTAATQAVLLLKPRSLSQKMSHSQWLQNLILTYEQLFPGESDFLTFKAQWAMNKPNSALPAKDLLQWPWRQGYSWQPNGAHGNSGSGFPLSSIDLSYDWPYWGGRTYKVTAAHDGVVKLYSRCNVRITHKSGWQTNYYHMEGLKVTSGMDVNFNEVIGTYADDRNTALCQGGSSTGPHMHFSLLKNGYYKSLNDVNLGPHKIHVGNYSYDSNCSRFWIYDTVKKTKSCAYKSLENFGRLDGGYPIPPFGF